LRIALSVLRTAGSWMGTDLRAVEQNEDLQVERKEQITV
jgi:hypothetical protein